MCNILYHFFSCWLPVADGLIAAFITPMLAVLLVSVCSPPCMQLHYLFMGYRCLWTSVDTIRCVCICPRKKEEIKQT